ncbi:MAG: DUF3465 domain-containing protein [Methylomonas sp.]|nr:DUF3465 domain-containing protein [Methylomonas sp.]
MKRKIKKTLARPDFPWSITASSTHKLHKAATYSVYHGNSWRAKTFLYLALISQSVVADNSEFNFNTGLLSIPSVIIGNELIYDARLQLNSEGLFSVVSYRNTAENHLSTTKPLLIQGSGVVDRILPDDTDGSQHQKFILKLASGQTILISHNIDLAPRINSLNLSDTVDFYGEYVWNSQGGLVHWTHHDPDNLHENGWLIHENIIYQ